MKSSSTAGTDGTRFNEVIKCNVIGKKSKYFSFITPKDCNKLLLELKKPKLFTDKKEAFTTSFRTFQVGVARHCALIACVDEASRNAITFKTIMSLVQKMQWVKDLEESSDVDDDVHDDERKNAKELLSCYRKHLKTICQGVHDPLGNELFEFIKKDGLTKSPKSFLNLMRQKRKKGMWKNSDEYSAEKLYLPFYTVCSDLNLFNE